MYSKQEGSLHLKMDKTKQGGGTMEALYKWYSKNRWWKAGVNLLLAGCMAMLACPVHAKDAVKIVGIFAQTGKAAANDIPFIRVAQLSIDEINKQGGLLGKPVDYELIDNQSKPISAQAAAEEAVKKKASAVVGAVWSSQSLAMAPVLQEAGIPMITPVSTHPDVTLKGDYIFRACFTDTFQSKVLARFAYEKLKARKAGVIRIVDQEFSTKIANLFAESFEKLGGKLIFEGKCKSDAVDFKALLKEMKEAGPDVVFVPAYAKQSGFLVRQAAAMGVKTVFLSGDGWSQIIKYAGDAVNGNYHSTHWHPDVPIPASVAFCEAYKKKYGEEIPSQAAAVVYDAFMVLADAIRRADSSDPAKIRDALAATQNFQGITGKIQFDKNGDPIDKSIIIIKFENGKAIYDKAIQP